MINYKEENQKTIQKIMEKSKNNLNEQIKTYNELLKGLEILKGVVLDFDGKLFNKRFFTAFETKCKENNVNVYLQQSQYGGSLELDYYNYNHTYGKIETCVYLQDVRNHMSISFIKGFGEDEYGKVFASGFLQIIEKQIEYITKSIDKLQTNFKELPSTALKIIELAQTYNETAKNIHWQFWEIIKDQEIEVRYIYH